MTGYEDLPPLDAYDDSGSDYEEYSESGLRRRAGQCPRSASGG